MADTGPPATRATDEEEAERPVSTRVARAVIPGVVRRNYALKFTLSLLVVVLLTAGIGGVSYVQIQGIIEEDAENTLRSTATVHADGLGEWIAGMRSQTRAMAASDVYGTQSRDRIREHLQDSQLLVGGDVTGAHYVNPESEQIVASTDPDYDGASVRTVAPAWQSAIDRATANESDGGVTMTDRTYERNGQLLVAFVRPVRYGDGVIVVVADVRRGFERLHGSETVSTTSVVTTGGHEVTAPRQHHPLSIAGEPAFQRAVGEETSILERDRDVVAFAPVDGVDWIVVEEAPKGDLYEASETVGQNVVVLVVSTLTALGLVGFVLGRGTVVPLIRLRERAMQLEAGNFDVDLGTDREDEIGRLFEAFGQMRDALRDQIRETEAARDRAERSRNELARQNDRLDKFASTVSHDLRNPLNVADGHREGLEEMLEDGDVDLETLEEHVHVIDESHARMRSIIDDVLALAREGATIDETTPVDLESVATEAWRNVDGGGAEFEVVDTRTLEADRDRLLRSFENLFRNAIEHGTDEDGTPPRVEVGTTDDGYYVADDGPGIPPDAVDDVFEYGHTTADDGTGFGLAIVEAIVSAHGWTVEIDEAYADGARFVVGGVDQ